MWRRRASGICALPIRLDALAALTRKRGNTNGAALFWVIPQVRNYTLLKLLVTYQVMWDFLDTASETGAAAGYQNGFQLHLALVEALDPQCSISNYYHYHPWAADGGYLQSLVESCRHLSTRLPSFDLVRPIALREARRANVQALNHGRDRQAREVALRRWVEQEYPGDQSATWFELAAAAGAGISIYALFALAVQSECSGVDIVAVYNAYFPWASALATMLDSYVDQQEDAQNEAHIYLEHYTLRVHAHRGIREMITRALREVGGLPEGERHTLVLGCMVAMYLSKDSALKRPQRATTLDFLAAAGSLPKLLLPVLWVWRSAYGQKAY